ncbi:MAG: flippase-like domain-containing protein [Chloroflexi bacterium]|nr:flippase-like domain-containing protein [Chloroflexota bacterium]
MLVVRGIDWAELVAGLRAARSGELGAAFALVSLSFFVRGLRWGILLSAQRTVAPGTLFWATATGYLGNYSLPARAGEFIRSLALAQKTAINASYVLATALTERIFDALTLVIISAAALSTLSDVPETLVIATRTMAVVGLVGVLGVLIAPRLEPLVEWVLDRLRLPAHLHSRLHSVAAQFLLGMHACQHTRRALGFAALTALVWSVDAVMAVMGGQALGLPLTLAESLVLLAMLGLSSAIPSTPGYIGVFQFVAVVVLTRYDYSREEALAYILTYQAISYLAALLYGLIGIWQLNARQFLSGRRRAGGD